MDKSSAPAGRAKEEGTDHDSRSARTPVVWLAVGAAAGVLLTALYFFYGGRTGATPIYISPPAPLTSPLPSPTTGPIRVYVSGEVARPAVYELPPGSIVQDLVRAAGGFTAQADGRLVNLAQPLADGLQVHVPAQGEASAAPSSVVRAPAAVEVTASLINLNTAGPAELEQLPGIGPALAQRIVDYRQANGAFARVDDIVNVSGIGPATLEKIRDLVTIGQ